MEALKKILAEKRNDPTNKAPVVARAELEAMKRDKYLQQMPSQQENEEKLGKRLVELDKYYDEGFKVKDKETFEPMKKVITQKKKNKKAEKEEEDLKKVKEADTTKRDISEYEIELTQDKINVLMERNKLFEERLHKAVELKVARPDLAVETPYEEQCEDVHVWVLKTMRDWEQDILGQPRGWDNTLEGRKAIELFRETRRIFYNLYELLVLKTCNSLILNKYYHIAHYCLLKEYVSANDNYIDLSIGNAPWPIGVTMVGIHERSGRAKIFTSQIAHIMNDESQKQLVLNMKRLITFSQKKFPTNPSKMVMH